jgi:antitoxin CptB
MKPRMTEPKPPQSLAPLDVRIKRLKYRAWHRGFKEADLVLGPYADAHAAAMSEVTLTEFEFLLTAPDQDLYDWILGRAAPDPDYDGPVLRAIMDTVAERRT